MSTRVDIEEIEATKSEKFLAVVLAAFLLIGSIWFYIKVDEWVRPAWEYSVTEQKAVDAQTDAQARQEKADVLVEQSRVEVGLAKDALDIALAKGEPSAPLEADYDAKVVQYAKNRDAAKEARRDANQAYEAVAIIDKNKAEERNAPARQWASAGIRLGFIVGWLLVSFRLVGSLRRKQSRFLPLGFAAAGAGVITALVYATDYITDYIDPLDLGPIVLSAAGAAATIGAFVGLQRWLARRIPGRRVRNGECPFCGHPVRGEAPHCEGCGREVIASCASCGAPRHVGSAHCGHCGQA